MTNLLKSQTEFAHDIAVLIDYIYTNNYLCTFGDAFRSPEQALLNQQKGIGIKNSLHCKRLAVDLNLFSSKGEYLPNAKDYEIFGTFWESLDCSNRWGGRFKNADANHFERQI